MEIHKPKPWHGWREFLKEYGIIVLGVLTALAGEQVVENIHYRSEAHEAREALKIEMEYDLWGVENKLKLGSCVAQRLSDLDRWRELDGSDRPLRLSRPIAGPIYLNPDTSVWRIATTSVVARMPFQDRVNYARFYDELDSFDRLSQRSIELWRDLALVGNGKRLNEEKSDRVINDLNALKSAGDLSHTDGDILLNEGKRLELVPKSDAPFLNDLHQKQASFCQPILVPSDRGSAGRVG